MKKHYGINDQVIEIKNKLIKYIESIDEIVKNPYIINENDIYPQTVEDKIKDLKTETKDKILDIKKDILSYLKNIKIKIPQPSDIIDILTNNKQQTIGEIF